MYFKQGVCVARQSKFINKYIKEFKLFNLYKEILYYKLNRTELMKAIEYLIKDESYHLQYILIETNGLSIIF